MPTRRLRSFFFTITNAMRSDGTIGGVRFRTEDKPQQLVYEQLTESVGFIGETDDTATTSAQGFVKLATAAQAKAGTDSASGFALVVTPSTLQSSSAYIKGAVDGAAQQRVATAQPVATGVGANAHGQSTLADSDASSSFGVQSRARHVAEIAEASGCFDAEGDVQTMKLNLMYSGDDGATGSECELKINMSGVPQRIRLYENSTQYTIFVVFSAVFDDDGRAGITTTFSVYKDSDGVITIDDENELVISKTGASADAIDKLNMSVIDGNDVALVLQLTTAWTPATDMRAHASVKISKTKF